MRCTHPHAHTCYSEHLRIWTSPLSCESLPFSIMWAGFKIYASKLKYHTGFEDRFFLPVKFQWIIHEWKLSFQHVSAWLQFIWPHNRCSKQWEQKISLYSTNPLQTHSKSRRPDQTIYTILFSCHYALYLVMSKLLNINTKIKTFLFIFKILF